MRVRGCLGGPDFETAEAFFLLSVFFFDFCFVAMASAYPTLVTKNRGFELPAAKRPSTRSWRLVRICQANGLVL